MTTEKRKTLMENKLDYRLPEGRGMGGIEEIGEGD